MRFSIILILLCSMTVLAFGSEPNVIDKTPSITVMEDISIEATPSDVVCTFAVSNQCGAWMFVLDASPFTNYTAEIKATIPFAESADFDVRPAPDLNGTGLDCNLILCVSINDPYMSLRIDPGIQARCV